MKDIGFKVGDYVTVDQLHKVFDVWVLLINYNEYKGGTVVYIKRDENDKGAGEVFEKYRNKVTVYYMSSKRVFKVAHNE